MFRNRIERPGIAGMMVDVFQQWVAAMRAEQYESAWDIALRSLAARDPSTRDDPAKPYHLRWVWDGQPVDGRHVLVRCYHGLGDTLQFARFLPALAERAASVVLEVQPRLIPLLQGTAGLAAIVPFDPARPSVPSECDIEITELDLALRLPPSAAPAPFLNTSRAILPAGTVALCYGAGDWDPERSVPPELFAPLCRHAPSISLVPGPSGLHVLNPAGCPFDMEATAALVTGADLVITVDTMIAHLAGATGRPTWLLLKAEPDWRWPTNSRSTPWYGSIRLYRQQAAGDWSGVLARVEADLADRQHSAARG